MSSLKRMQVGNFTLNKALKLEEIEEHKTDLKFIQDKIITIEEFFEKNAKITLNNKKLELFLNGVKLNVQNIDGIYKIYDEKEEFIGTGEVKNNKLKRDVII